MFNRTPAHEIPDTPERLATILEPISALDETARVMLSAVQIACLNRETTSEACAALLEKFVSLQNLPNGEVESFSVLAKSAPRAFLQAAQAIHLSQVHFANDEWLLYALLNRRKNPDVWREILQSVKLWLSYYSLAPERGMLKTAGPHTAAEVEEDRTNTLVAINERLSGLTEVEQSYIKTKLEIAPHPKFDALSRFAFFLMAAMPGEEIAPYLVRWRLSHSLNSSPFTPYSEFEQVLQFNRTDWPAARTALLKELGQLPLDSASSVGKWTHVGILHCTGDVGDAQEASRIRNDHLPPRQEFSGWSLREDYCSVDPCDPAASRPENVLATAARYRQIDPRLVATSRGMGEQDHLFQGARACVARFKAESAFLVHRALANDVLCRSGYARRQGVLELRRHSATLTQDQAHQFLSAGLSSTASYKEGVSGKDEFLTAQYSILIALPHLTADEQLDAIANMQSDTCLIELLSCLRKASAEKVEQVMERILQTGNEHTQTAVLAAIHYTDAPLSSRAVAIAKGFIRSTSKNVRYEALAVAASIANKDLLKEVLESGWSAENSHQRDTVFEDWHGSTAVWKAMQAGLIDASLALSRVNLSHYGFIAQALPADQVYLVAERVETALFKALGYSSNPDLPDIATKTPTLSDVTPPMISLTERAQSQNDLPSLMRGTDESDSQFEERQRRMGSAYDRFAAEITTAEADLILSDLTFDGVRAIIAHDVQRGEAWFNALLSASDHQLRHLHHFALQVAIALGAANQEVADFIARVLKLDPTIRRVSGDARIPAEAVAIWTNVTKPSMRIICENRLISRRTDGEIAQDVIAAHYCGKITYLEAFIDRLLGEGRPYETALALTIAGFCDESPHAEAVLSRYDDASGFIGTAHNAASEAYRKNVWAKTWYNEMLKAQRPDDFWRACVLFTKIVDARFYIWPVRSGPGSPVFTAFMPTIKREIESQAAKRQKKYEANLFGEKAPVSIMLGGEAD